LVGAVLVCVGRFRPSLGPFWRWAVLVGSLCNLSNGAISSDREICVRGNSRVSFQVTLSDLAKHSVTQASRLLSVTTELLDSEYVGCG